MKHKPNKPKHAPKHPFTIGRKTTNDWIPGSEEKRSTEKSTWVDKLPLPKGK